MAVAAVVVAKTAFELAIAKPSLRPYLLNYARKHVRNPDDGPDAVALAYKRAAEREAKGDHWTPATGPTIEKHLFDFLRGALSNQRRRDRKAPFEPLEEPDAVLSAVPDPEKALVQRDLQAERRELLKQVRAVVAATKHGTRALDVMDALDEGITDYSQLADRLGCGLEDVRKARKAIGEHAQKLVGQFRALEAGGAS
jgi:DNA-directed RNA polymerase specialized sigma24 family protein